MQGEHMDHIRSNLDRRMPAPVVGAARTATQRGQQSKAWRMSTPFWPAFALLALGALPLSTVTAETSAANTSSSDTVIALEEIVVTAEKRSETALRTPVALSAYSGENLQEHQIISVSDLQNLDPSVNVSRSARGNAIFIAIRGVTTADTTSASSPGIAFNVDGIPLNRGVEQTAAFFDLERVEVLKGPQGTLYGQSSTGGAVNIITNKPKNELAASADVTVGVYNDRATTAMINLPLTGGIALRAAVNSNKHDGYLIPADGSAPLNDQDNFTSRVSLLDSFSDDMSLLLTQTNGNV